MLGSSVHSLVTLYEQMQVYPKNSINIEVDH